jgi:hypothetical protein
LYCRKSQRRNDYGPVGTSSFNRVLYLNAKLRNWCLRSVNTSSLYSRSKWLDLSPLFQSSFSEVGFRVIFYTLVFRNYGNTRWPAVVVNAVIEAVPELFFHLTDKAHKQMIDVFVDLRHDNEVARAYELLRTMKNPDKLEGLKEEIIRHTLLHSRHRERVSRATKALTR